MEKEIKPGDIVYNADASRQVVAYKIESCVLTLDTKDRVVVYRADKHGSSKQLRANETFLSEQEARNYLLDEAAHDYANVKEEIESKPVKIDLIDTTELAPQRDI